MEWNHAVFIQSRHISAISSLVRRYLLSSCGLSLASIWSQLALIRSTKREILEWIETRWEKAGAPLAIVAANQQKLPIPSIPPQRVKIEEHQ
jgi:hypothetical protein